MSTPRQDRPERRDSGTHYQSLLVFSLVGASFGIVGSVASTMLLFLGKVGADPTGLLTMQALGAPLVVVPLLVYFTAYRKVGDLPSRVWQHTPGWLLAAASVLLGMAESGFVALVIVKLSMDRAVTVEHYVPVISTSVFCVVWWLAYAFRSLNLHGFVPPGGGRAYAAE